MMTDYGGTGGKKKGYSDKGYEKNGDAYCDKEERTIQSQDNHVCVCLYVHLNLHSECITTCM